MEGGRKVVWKVINVKKRVRDAYKAGGNEAAYAAYRAIMGVGVQES
jgi:hypothetical protein